MKLFFFQTVIEVTADFEVDFDSAFGQQQSASSTVNNIQSTHNSAQISQNNPLVNPMSTLTISPFIDTSYGYNTSFWENVFFNFLDTRPIL